MCQPEHDYQHDPAMFDEAFWEGYYSYGEGVSILENPYRQDEDEVKFFEAWQEGWSAAAWDD